VTILVNRPKNERTISNFISLYHIVPVTNVASLFTTKKFSCTLTA